VSGGRPLLVPSKIGTFTIYMFPILPRLTHEVSWIDSVLHSDFLSGIGDHAGGTPFEPAEELAKAGQALGPVATKKGAPIPMHIGIGTACDGDSGDALCRPICAMTTGTCLVYGARPSAGSMVVRGTFHG